MPGLHPMLCNACFERNLTALRARQPDVAAALAEAQPPGGATLTVGRDGCPLAMLEADGDTVRWLGGSSAPSVSIPARFGAWEDRGGNVALPSIGSGYEALHLTALLGGHRAVFVCEPDVSRVALALAAVELADVIASGQVVLLTGDLADAAVTFFRAHPGYLYPAQIVGMASGDAATLADCKAALDRASPVVDDHLRGVVAATLDGYRPDPMPRAVGRLLVISVDQVGGAVDFARELADAAPALGLTVETIAATRPERAAVVPYLQRLAAFQPDLVLFLNGSQAVFGSHWPSDQPSVGWFLESERLAAASLAGLAHAARTFAASSRVAELLVGHGASRERVTVVERGVDTTFFTPNDEQRSPLPATPADAGGAVVLLADLNDIRPSAVHIRLDSHLRLWQGASRLATAALAAGAPLEPAALLEQAERETGVAIEEAALRRQLIGLIEDPLITTLSARAAAAALAGRPGLVIYGRGWKDDATHLSAWRGLVPVDAARRAMYDRAEVVVLPSLSARDARWALEALACERLPVMRRHVTGWHASYPAAAAVLSQLPAFSSPAELKELVAQARDLVVRRGWIGPLHERLMAEMTVAQSLARVIHGVSEG